MKPQLTWKELYKEAVAFCKLESSISHPELLNITDGKAVGTYIEHRFQQYLSERYQLETGNSASGIDLPGESVNTDIKSTSVQQPQSSCPYKDASQKIYGLGYNLLLFVYEKKAVKKQCYLFFQHCAFIKSTCSGDYSITKRLREMLADHANAEDIAGYLSDRCIPGDEVTLYHLAERIIQQPPSQGYLTISNALQWRLQYSRILSLDNSVQGIQNYDNKEQ